MLPPVMPAMRSMSFGVITCRPTMARRMFGACRSSVAITVSPNASRFASSQPPSMSYGAYCTKHDMTWWPGGAMSRSIMDGMMMSMYGWRENWPYLASS